MASRNGLNPKLRGLKGLGFNRALPSAFGFGNGIQPNNNGMRVPTLERGWLYNPVCTFEFWTKCPSSSGSIIWAQLEKTAGSRVAFNFVCFDGKLGLGSTDKGYSVLGNNVTFDGSKQHIVFAGDAFGNFTIYLNGVYQGVSLGQVGGFSPETFDIFYNDKAKTSPFDEMRYYNKQLNAGEVLVNYNDGFGANPCVTESLLFWYQFESFETLDFSAAQNGSDMRLGVRDMSNNNNHALPVNMDTNPASPTYVLKPF